MGEYPRSFLFSIESSVFRNFYIGLAKLPHRHPGNQATSPSSSSLSWRTHHLLTYFGPRIRRHLPPSHRKSTSLLEPCRIARIPFLDEVSHVRRSMMYSLAAPPRGPASSQKLPLRIKPHTSPALLRPSSTTNTHKKQRERSRSRSPRRRSRSPRRSRRSYSPRSRSRSRDDYHRRSDRRSRSPGNGAAGGSATYNGSGFGGSRAPPVKSFEERAVAKEHMMQSVRDSSQQDRRVYIGNLSYDVKWHHLKDFMRQGGHALSISWHISNEANTST